jgi:ADP-ribose pyrophosphatase
MADIDRWPAGPSEEIFHSRIVSITEREAWSPTDPDRRGRFIRLRCSAWVNVIARTTDGDLVFIEQYRHGTESVTLEIAGGLVDEGESPLEAGVRELQEETGYVGGTARMLGSVEVNPAIQDNRCFTVFVDGCTATGEQKFDDHEEIAVHLHPESAVDRLISEGHVTHSLVIAAFHLWGIDNRQSTPE